ncbi:hypothetical protein B5F12_00505 [Pseudoflavonifractor sp. An176]|uniref:hypothetical protein n=1 Tax=Pseudoflavonifractor sp. An176 TaxID=1965572 RepID=UPI000B370C97|nr:hypothetical protein [Pseudoflavonifractor sp. An176]OUP66039.1 hypothetical protein B5F12_00505 [Pseudoflavonifractor sp. An176]
MEGQVFVQYTGIGGNNLDQGIMTMSVEGSSAEAGIEGGLIPSTNVTWVLPGGITNRKFRIDPITPYQGGEWGYMLHTKEDSPIPNTDNDVIAWVSGKHPDAEFDENGNLTTIGLETTIESDINKELYDYVRRAMSFQGGSDWRDFVEYFALDICVFIR